MAKQQSGKQANKTHGQLDTAKLEEGKLEADKPDVNNQDSEKAEPSEVKPVASSGTKTISSPATRPKKTKGSSTKQGSIMPSEHKLEHLTAAVAAAGGADNLLRIMHHIEEAGGQAEVTESIETYRALKTAVEQS